MATESLTRIDSGPTDRELVQRMLAGDEQAFDQLSKNSSVNPWTPKLSLALMSRIFLSSSVAY